MTSHLLAAAAGPLCNASQLNHGIPMKQLVHAVTPTTVTYMKHVAEYKPNASEVQHRIRKQVRRMRKRKFNDVIHKRIEKLGMFNVLQVLAGGGEKDVDLDLEQKMMECFERAVKYPRSVKGEQQPSVEEQQAKRIKDNDEIITITSQPDDDSQNDQAQSEIEVFPFSTHHGALPILSSLDIELPAVSAFTLPPAIQSATHSVYLEDVQMSALVPQLVETNIWKHRITPEVAALASRVAHMGLRNRPQVIMGGKYRMKVPSELWCQSNSLAIYVLIQKKAAVICVQGATYWWPASKALVLKDTAALSLATGCSDKIEILVLRRRGATLSDLSKDLLVFPL